MLGLKLEYLDAVGRELLTAAEQLEFWAQAALLPDHDVLVSRLAVLLMFVYGACTICANVQCSLALARLMSCCSCSVLHAHGCRSPLGGVHLKQDLVQSDMSHSLYPCLHLAQWHVPQTWLTCRFMQCMLIQELSRPPQLQVARMQVHKRTLLELERFSTGALSAQLQKQQTDVRQTWKILTALLDTATQLPPGQYLARHEPDAPSICLLTPVRVTCVTRCQVCHCLGSVPGQTAASCAGQPACGAQRGAPADMCGRWCRLVRVQRVPVLEVWTSMPHTRPLEQQMRARWDRLQPSTHLNALSGILHVGMQQCFDCQADLHA